MKGDVTAETMFLFIVIYIFSVYPKGDSAFLFSVVLLGSNLVLEKQNFFFCQEWENMGN